jgi:hypothetical protein
MSIGKITRTMFKAFVSKSIYMFIKILYEINEKIFPK